MDHFDDSNHHIEGTMQEKVLLPCPSCGTIHDLDFYGPGTCKLCLELADGVRQNEIDACLILAQSLKNIESIGWSSFFGGKRKSRKNKMMNQIDLGRKVTVNIVRLGGKVVGTSTGRAAVVS